MRFTDVGRQATDNALGPDFRLHGPNRAIAQLNPHISAWHHYLILTATNVRTQRHFSKTASIVDSSTALPWGPPQFC
jgi:hypothetical protein